MKSLRSVRVCQRVDKERGSEVKEIAYESTRETHSSSRDTMILDVHPGGRGVALLLPLLCSTLHSAEHYDNDGYCTDDGALAFLRSRLCFLAQGTLNRQKVKRFTFSRYL